MDGNVAASVLVCAAAERAICVPQNDRLAVCCPANTRGIQADGLTDICSTHFDLRLCSWLPDFSGYSPANASHMLLSTAAVVCTDTDIQPTTKELNPANGPEESGPPGFRRPSPPRRGWSYACRCL